MSECSIVSNRRSKLMYIVLFKNYVQNLCMYSCLTNDDQSLCILLRARPNKKEMKVKPATSFNLLTIFIHKK